MTKVGDGEGGYCRIYIATYKLRIFFPEPYSLNPEPQTLNPKS
jgi:hypothetical protein